MRVKATTRSQVPRLRGTRQPAVGRTSRMAGYPAGLVSHTRGKAGRRTPPNSRMAGVVRDLASDVQVLVPVRPGGTSRMAG